MHIESVLFFFVCAISIFTWSQQMVDTSIIPKWYYGFVVLFVGGMTLSIKKITGKNIRVNAQVFIHTMVILCVAQALYGITNNLHLTDYLSGFRIMGSFDNPAGFASCLSIVLPFIWFFTGSSTPPVFRKMHFFMAFVLIIAVCLSGSRAGIISMVIATGCWWFKAIRVKSRTKILFFVALLVLLGLSAYFVKKDSADGRMLIWKCSLEMIGDAPLFGHGLGGFKAHYMDYQADYFTRNPDDVFARLADTVQHPFNEYLLVLVNYGIIGFLCLLAVVGFSIYAYFRKPFPLGKAALYSLLTLAIFSLFSYPFTYPFTWIIFIFCLYLPIHHAYPSLRVNRWLAKSISVFLFFLSLGGLYQLKQQIDAEWGWKQAVSSDSGTAFAQYPRLAETLGNDRYFLYNYAVMLFENDRFEESLSIARQCRMYWADYDLEILLGDICKRLRMYQDAEYHYSHASMMCPCRFHPLNFLHDLYIETGNEERALAIAAEIIEKPIKVRSLAVSQIKYKMKQYLLKADSCK